VIFSGLIMLVFIMLTQQVESEQITKPSRIQEKILLRKNEGKNRAVEMVNSY
jgi:hypothetical protein